MNCQCLLSTNDTPGARHTGCPIFCVSYDFLTIMRLRPWDGQGRSGKPRLQDMQHRRTRPPCEVQVENHDLISSKGRSEKDEDVSLNGKHRSNVEVKNDPPKETDHRLPHGVPSSVIVDDRSGRSSITDSIYVGSLVSSIQAASWGGGDPVKRLEDIKESEISVYEMNYGRQSRRCSNHDTRLGMSECKSRFSPYCANPLPPTVSPNASDGDGDNSTEVDSNYFYPRLIAGGSIARAKSSFHRKLSSSRRKQQPDCQGNESSIIPTKSSGSNPSDFSKKVDESFVEIPDTVHTSNDDIGCPSSSHEIERITVMPAISNNSSTKPSLQHDKNRRSSFHGSDHPAERKFSNKAAQDEFRRSKGHSDEHCKSWQSFDRLTFARVVVGGKERSIFKVAAAALPLETCL